ncbi:flagellar filament capping protein FliD [Thiorhodococcus mannitoliphagus]|uniref:Flagellar hook-associated protein 2 n=1 Tax=Thiorhodococcus mannitoliphagus TaxID=329406 RepID=A0A6P1DTS0_9GAMM|nr:flagellar filament capping protein FliD [Thiorhodococcus mannitoliphagus]NEX21717.1 flagellar filament capping protein FliD [Thiorhodococcus mannitoliphagus]
MANNIISSLGAGSGIDITNLVSQLVEVERAPQQQRLDTRQEKLQAQISGYGQMKSALDGLRTVVGTLGSNDLFNARSVSVPTTDVITADKVNAGAQTGTYQIEVLEVASAQSLAMAAQAERDSALGKSGEISIRFGDWTYDVDGDPATADAPLSFAVNDERTAFSISIEATDSLDSIAEKINSEKSGVQASVLKVDGQFQLMLTSPSGASNALEISVDDPSLDLFAFNATTFASVTETQQAKDAQLKVNGLQVSRESNSINDVIEGFEFTLNKAAVGEKLSYSIKADTSTAEQAVRDFVEAYNSFRETAENLVGYSRDEDNQLVRGDLAGDGSARLMVERVRQMVGDIVPGAEGGFTALTNLGIRTELDGSLSIEEDEFSDAINNNFELLEGLFATKTSSTNSAVSVNMGTYVSEVAAGTYNVEITQDPTRGELLASAITDAGFNALDDTFATALDASGGGYSFKIKVDGVESDLIELTGTYASADELRADLQARINSDEKLKAGRVSLDVGFDTATDGFTFTSREYGSVSKVSFSEASAGMADLGIDASLSGTTGVDVVGTINGEAGFGAGNLLLPAIGSDAYGLNFTVGAGATAQGAFEVNFSRGLAGELTNLIDSFLGSSGAIDMRLDTIDSQLESIDEDQIKLDTRMDALNIRLTTQFSAMESIINSLSSTGSQLDGLTDRLPFTAKS